MNASSDRHLFEALRNGNRQALSILYVRHYDYLMHYGLQIGASRYEVEGCLQELFVYLFESFDHFGEVNQVRAYLFKSLRRRVIELQKKENRLKSIQEKYLTQVDVQFTIEDIVVKEEQEMEKSAALLSALNNLPQRQREAVYLRYYNNLSTREISAVMGVTDQTILNTLYQALKNLRTCDGLRALRSYCLPWLMIFCHCI